MKLGVGLDINCGVKRSAPVQVTFSYTGPNGDPCIGPVDASRTQAVGPSAFKFIP